MPFLLRSFSPYASPFMTRVALLPLPLTADYGNLATMQNSVGAHPELNFLVVVNPNSGPGDGPLPGDDYIREVPKLNTFPNVLTVGYVRAGWCKRPLKDTIEDIGLFAGWRLHDIPGLYVNGIYLDETPNHISRESTAFLDATTNFIKSVNGLIGRRLVCLPLYCIGALVFVVTFGVGVARFALGATPYACLRRQKSGLGRSQSRHASGR